MSQLTSRQEQILQFIRDYIAEHGLPPSRSEITDAVGLSSANAIQGHLERLVKKGYVELRPGRSRNIQLTDKAKPDERGLPLVGSVAAGSPIVAEQNIEGYYHCESLFRPAPHYLLRVQGMSMRDAGIMDGDLLAVHRTPEAHNGQIVVARLDDEVTVKRFEKKVANKKSTIRLLPENPDFEPIVIDPLRDTVEIEGIYVGLVRTVR